MKRFSSIIISFLLVHLACPAGDLLLKAKSISPELERAMLPGGVELPEGQTLKFQGTLEKRTKGLSLRSLPGVAWELEESPKVGKGAAELIQKYSATKKNGKIEIKSQGWEGLSQWTDSKHQFALEQYPDLHQAFADLSQKTVRFASSEATPEDRKIITDSLAETKRVIAIKFDQEANPDRKHSLCKTFANLNRHGKAFYGASDNYQPLVYNRIFHQSPASVAIRPQGRSPEGSGVVIGKNLVLTCQHVLKAAAPNATDYEVVLNFQDGNPGSAFSIKNVLLRGSTVASALEPMDFALLEVADMGQEHPQTPVLSSSRLRHGDPIYLIGHPRGGSKMVHDNAFVLFPFQVAESEMPELQLSVCAEFSGSPDEEREMKEFLDSYKAPKEGERTFFELFSRRWRQQPTIAANCDTFHGNSGSPAYFRSTGELIGILFDGEADINEPQKAGWNRHEAILPISKIIEQIQAWKPSWVEDYKVDLR